MISARNLVIPFCLAMISMSLIHAQDLSKYREFQLGMDLSAVTKQTGMKSPQMRLIHQRPAMIQELEWMPQNSSDSPPRTDAVKKVLFGFYNGQLYRIVVDYDEDKIEGLTEEDLIESISAEYGKPTMPVAKIVSSSSSQVYSDSERVLARWEDSQNSLNLFRFSYHSTFGLLVFSKRLEALAQVAIVEAIRLNEQEAPQRAIEMQKKQDEDKRIEGLKARSANKEKFRP
jgi:hypothetical protein